MLAGGFTCATCMDFSGEEELVLSKGMQETSRDFLVFAENRRPHLGYCSSKPHFRHAMHSASLGTRSLVLPEFSGLARKTNTPLLKVKSLSNSFFKEQFWLFFRVYNESGDELSQLASSTRVLTVGVCESQIETPETNTSQKVSHTSHKPSFQSLNVTIGVRLKVQKSQSVTTQN